MKLLRPTIIVRGIIYGLLLLTVSYVNSINLLDNDDHRFTALGKRFQDMNERSIAQLIGHTQYNNIMGGSQ